ncbi:MAG: DUF424 family protein [Nanoarchaeota archaeon]
MSYLIKVHKTYRSVVAVCDEEIIGKNYEEGQKVLQVPESFYKGEIIATEKELMELLVDLAAEDSTFNIAGKRSVDAAIKAGLVNKKGVGTVQGIPFALILL